MRSKKDGKGIGRNGRRAKGRRRGKGNSCKNGLNRRKPGGETVGVSVGRYRRTSSKRKEGFDKFDMSGDVCPEGREIKTDVGTLASRITKEDASSGVQVKLVTRVQSEPWVA